MSKTTKSPTRVFTSVEQVIDVCGNVTSIQVIRTLNYEDNLKDTSTVQSFDLSIIPYDVALSLACQIISGFRNSSAK